MGKRIALIGAGLTGTSFLWQLAQELGSAACAGAPDRDDCIDVFERHAVTGPGLPHSSAHVLPCHITNMCARDMGIAANHPRDFQDWVEAREHSGTLGHRADTRLPGKQETPDSDCHHYPRAWMGHYLADRFSAAVAKLEAAGIRVRIHTRCEVVDLELQERGFVLQIREEGKSDASPRQFDRVLLATGHWFPTQSEPRVIPSPWPAERLLEQIPAGAEVGVLGSSLSAIESVLTLTLDGRFARDETGRLMYQPGDKPRRMTLFSRRGQLPRVRGRLGARPNRMLSPQALERLTRERKGSLTLAELFDLLEQELSLAYGRAWQWQDVTAPEASSEKQLRESLRLAQEGDGAQGEVIWQTVLAQALPWAAALYRALAPEERGRFDREWTTLFFLHVATQPASNAEKVLALMEAGLVEVVALREGYRLAADDEGVTLEVDREVSPRRWRVDWLVDARGQPGAYVRCEDALPRALVARGELALTEGRFAGLRVDSESLEVERRVADGSTRIRGLYAIGTPTRSQMLDASMARGLVVAAARVSKQIARWLQEGDILMEGGLHGGERLPARRLS